MSGRTHGLDGIEVTVIFGQMPREPIVYTIKRLAGGVVRVECEFASITGDQELIGHCEAAGMLLREDDPCAR